MKKQVLTTVGAFILGAGCATVVYSQVNWRMSLRIFEKAGIDLAHETTQLGVDVIFVDGNTIMVDTGTEGQCVDPPEPNDFTRGTQAVKAFQAGIAYKKKPTLIAGTKCQPY